MKRMAFIALLFCAASISAPAQLTTLASFDKTDGSVPAYPAAPFVQGTNGNFFGTTAAGGANDEGAVFEMTPTGKLDRLYSFCSNRAAVTAPSPMPAWCKPLMEISMERRPSAVPTTKARS